MPCIGNERSSSPQKHAFFDSQLIDERATAAKAVNPAKISSSFVMMSCASFRFSMSVTFFSLRKITAQKTLLRRNWNNSVA